MPWFFFVLMIPLILSSSPPVPDLMKACNMVPPENEMFQYCEQVYITIVENNDFFDQNIFGSEDSLAYDVHILSRTCQNYFGKDCSNRMHCFLPKGMRHIVKHICHRKDNLMGSFAGCMRAFSTRPANSVELQQFLKNFTTVAMKEKCEILEHNHKKIEYYNLIKAECGTDAAVNFWHLRFSLKTYFGCDHHKNERL